MKKILIIEDDIVDQMALERFIRFNEFPYDYEVANTIKSAKELLENKVYDVILSDYYLPDGTVFDILEMKLQAPIVVVTGTGSEQIAVKALKQGAFDYLIKDVDGHYLNMLKVTIDNALDRYQKELELLAYQQNLHEKVEQRTRELEIEMNARYQLEKQTIILNGAINQSPVMIAITDQDCKIKYVNRKYCQTTLYKEDEFIGNQMEMLNSDYHDQDFYLEMSNTIKEKKTWKGELCNKKKNGELYWELASISPSYDKSGNFLGYIKIAEDITSRKKEEEQKDVIYQLSNAVYRSKSLEELVQIINDQIKKIIYNESFYIGFYHKETDSFTSPLMKDEQDHDIDEWPAAKSLSGKVVYSKEALMVDEELMQKWLDAGEIDLIGAPSKCWIGVPLIHENEAVGVFALQNYEKEKDYSEEDLKLLTFIADQIGYAIIRKNSEIKIAESEQKFRTLYESLGDAVYVTQYGESQEGKILDANAAAVEQSGYSKEELLNMNIIHDLLIKDDHNIATSKVKEVINSRDKIVRFIEKKRHKNGSSYYTEVTITPIEYNGIKASLSINHDVTQRVHFEKMLMDSEKQFKAVIESAGDPMYIIDLETEKVILTNAEACRTLGYSLDELIGMNVHKINENFGPDKIIDNFWKAIELGEKLTLNVEHTKKDGSHFPVEVKTNIIEYNGKKCLLGFARDISERMKAVEALKQSEESYREILNTVSELIYVLDAKGNFIDVNQTVEEKYGYPHEYFIGKSPADLAAPGLNDMDAVRNYVEMAYNGTRSNFEFWARAYNGSVFLKEVSLSSGEFFGERVVIAVARDITERKKNENKLKDALAAATESDRLKTAFLHNISHEIRTPMSGIMGFADLISIPDITPERLASFIDIIKMSGKRMLNTLNDLMDISMLETKSYKLNFTDFFMEDELKNVHEFFKPEAERLGLDFFVNYPDVKARTKISSDREKVFAVMSNLIKNALKYTKEGFISIGIQYITEDDSDYMKFYIQDSGIGIPKERQKAIFERFVQADIEDSNVYEGSGLGLAICSGYLDLLGGDIFVESEENVGSLFYFRIPIHKAKEKKHKNKKSMQEISEQQKLNILIVEDDELSHLYLATVIQKYQKQLFTASNGKEGIEIYKKHPEIDLILMDMKMPVMNGYEATKAIREFDKDVIIIAETAYALMGDREKSLEAGCNDYVSKPIEGEILMGLLHKYFYSD